jgi:hypothetical protein
VVVAIVSTSTNSARSGALRDSCAIGDAIARMQHDALARGQP